MTEIKIEGVDRALEVLEAYPVNAHKVVDKAIRKAGTQAVKEVRNSVPHKSWRKLAKGRLKSKKEGSSDFKFGLFNKDGNHTSNATAPSWFRAYWLNYGTLSNRDKTHKFVKPRKKMTANWKGGIKAQNFFDPAAERALAVFEKKFKNELNKMTNEITQAKSQNVTRTTEIQ